MEHKVLTTYRTANGDVCGTATETADAEIAVDVSLSAESADVEIDVAFVRSKCKSILLYADKAVTIDTNSTSSPGDTIELQADKPWVWQNGGYVAQPLQADVTKLYASAALATTLKVRVLYDSTP